MEEGAQTITDTSARAAAVCGDPGAPWNPQAPPYAEQGPHDIGLIDDGVDSGDKNVYAKYDANLPGGWDGDGYPWAPGIQLISCVLPGRPLRQAGSVTCPFDKIVNLPAPGAPTTPSTTGAGLPSAGTPNVLTFPLYESSYPIEVHEARTGRIVARLTASGTDTDSASCPGLVLPDLTDETASVIVLRGLNGDGLEKALLPLFQDPAITTPPTDSGRTASPSPAVGASGVSNVAACSVGECEVSVGPGTVIPLPATTGVQDVRVTAVTGDRVTITGQDATSSGSSGCTGQCSVNDTNGAFTDTLGPGSKDTVNGVSIMVEGFSGGEALLRFGMT